MLLLASTLKMTQLSQVVLSTHGGYEAAWGSLSPARAMPAQHGETGPALHAMLRCAASEHPQIGWCARDASLAQAVPDTADHSPDAAAELVLWANTVTAPLLVPCAVCAPEDNLPEMVGFVAGHLFQQSPAGLVCAHTANVTSWPFRNPFTAQGPSRKINWMISGGLGALGTLMAARLEHGGCGGLSLLSRSGHFHSRDNAMRHLLCSHTSVFMERCSCAPLAPMLPPCTWRLRASLSGMSRLGSIQGASEVDDCFAGWTQELQRKRLHA